MSADKKNKLVEKTKQMQHSFVNILELPKDVMLDLPKITMVGDLQLYLENHRGIIEYHAERVRINISSGELQITGKDLLLRNLKPDEMMVEGKIFGITFKS